MRNVIEVYEFCTKAENSRRKVEGREAHRLKELLGACGETNGASRARREKRTVEAMVRLYCHGNHGSRRHLCEDCQNLLAYSHARVDKCPFIENKPTCARCPAHCYEKSKREKIKAVMRYSGPRMLTRHPVMAILHMIDGRRTPLGGNKLGARRRGRSRVSRRLWP